MSLSNAEIISIFAMTGVGRTPFTGGPAGSLKSTIAQTIPWEMCSTGGPPALSSGTMLLSSIYIATGQIISNINFISSNTAESGGSHLWFALYDDGRGSSTAGQLALLGQTADQTGAAAFGANANLGLSLLTPYTTTYSGIYFIGAMCVATTTPFLIGNQRFSSATVPITPATNCCFCCLGPSGLTNLAPSSITVSSSFYAFYAYVS
jgi:hypothetical protein